MFLVVSNVGLPPFIIYILCQRVLEEVDNKNSRVFRFINEEFQEAEANKLNGVADAQYLATWKTVALPAWGLRNELFYPVAE